MKLFLDSCNIKNIKKYSELGIISGITTTPTFAVKEGVQYNAQLINLIHKATGYNLDIYYTLAINDYDEILDAVRNTHNEVDTKTQPYVVYKLSTSYVAIKASNVLAEEGYRTALHLVYSVNQALLASKSKAENIFPLLGRSDDVGSDGIKLVKDINDAYIKNNIDTKIIAASVRHPQHVSELFKLGIYGATFDAPVFEKLVVHPSTSSGITDFRNDYLKSKHL